VQLCFFYQYRGSILSSALNISFSH